MFRNGRKVAISNGLLNRVQNWSRAYDESVGRKMVCNGGEIHIFPTEALAEDFYQNVSREIVTAPIGFVPRRGFSKRANDE